ncbi:MAG: hypothetical protein MZV70_20220 [Desulfobacterales bacterium]|nr:hypothetical protein [Desulfobacterales bacterium]
MSDIAQRSQSTPYDVQLLFPVLFLVGIGIVMVYSVELGPGHEKVRHRITSS